MIDYELRTTKFFRETVNQLVEAMAAGRNPTQLAQRAARAIPCDWQELIEHAKKSATARQSHVTRRAHEAVRAAERKAEIMNNPSDETLRERVRAINSRRVVAVTFKAAQSTLASDSAHRGAELFRDALMNAGATEVPGARSAAMNVTSELWDWNGSLYQINEMQTTEG